MRSSRFHVFKQRPAASISPLPLMFHLFCFSTAILYRHALLYFAKRGGESSLVLGWNSQRLGRLASWRKQHLAAAIPDLLEVPPVSLCLPKVVGRSRRSVYRARFPSYAGDAPPVKMFVLSRTSYHLTLRRRG